jgi:catechol 2,3-dioxygenase-like lactoylglutathione lyase family enzyme
MGVTLHSLRPMLRTKDLHATVQFWTDRLGFTCDGLSEEDGWASLFHDGVGLMLATPNAHVPFDTPGFTGSFYFDVDDVAAALGQPEGPRGNRLPHGRVPLRHA